MDRYPGPCPDITHQAQDEWRMKRTRAKSRTNRKERAQALIEFALLFPFIAALTFSIVDFGIALNRKIIFTNAAREAARFGSLGTTTNADNIKQVAVDQGEGQFTTAAVNVYWVDKNGDGQVRAGEPVVVQIDFTYDLPLLKEIFGVFGATLPSVNLGACADNSLVQDVTGVPISDPALVPCGGT